VPPRHIQPPDPVTRQVLDSARDGQESSEYSRIRPFGLPRRLTPGSGQANLDETAIVDPSSGAITVTLPTVTSQDVGRVVAIKNGTSSTNTITVDAGGGTIDGASTVPFSGAWAAVIFMLAGRDEWISVSWS
jgi:hypothetical protein